MNKLSKDIEKINWDKKALKNLFQTACFLLLGTSLNDKFVTDYCINFIKMIQYKQKFEINEEVL